MSRAVGQTLKALAISASDCITNYVAADKELHNKTNYVDKIQELQVHFF